MLDAIDKMRLVVTGLRGDIDLCNKGVNMLSNFRLTSSIMQAANQAKLILEHPRENPDSLLLYQIAETRTLTIDHATPIFLAISAELNKFKEEVNKSAGPGEASWELQLKTADALRKVLMCIRKRDLDEMADLQAEKESWVQSL